MKGGSRLLILASPKWIKETGSASKKLKNSMILFFPLHVIEDLYKLSFSYGKCVSGLLEALKHLEEHGIWWICDKLPVERQFDGLWFIPPWALKSISVPVSWWVQVFSFFFFLFFLWTNEMNKSLDLGYKLTNRLTNHPPFIMCILFFSSFYQLTNSFFTRKKTWLKQSLSKVWVPQPDFCVQFQPVYIGRFSCDTII